MSDNIVEFLGSSPLLKELIEQFPLPLGFSIADKIYLRNESFRARFPDFGRGAESDGTPPDLTDEDKKGTAIAQNDKNVNNDANCLTRSFMFSGERCELVLGVPNDNASGEECVSSVMLYRRCVASLLASRYGSRAAEIASDLFAALDLNVNIVIQSPPNTFRDDIVSLIRTLSPYNSRLIKRSDFEPKTIKYLFTGELDGPDASREITEGLTVLDGVDKMSIESQEALAKILSETEKVYGATETIVSLTPISLVELTARGKFSRALLKLLQTEKIVLPPYSAPSPLRNPDYFWGQPRDFEDGSDTAPPVGDDSNSPRAESESGLDNDAFLPLDAGDEDPGARATDLDIEKSIENAERECILKALVLSHGRKDKAAELLHMNLRTFHRRCARLGI